MFVSIKIWTSLFSIHALAGLMMIVPQNTCVLKIVYDGYVHGSYTLNISLLIWLEIDVDG